MAVLQITDRLRGKYVLAVNDGAGLLNGSDTFTRQFDTPPIQHEAAALIELLLTEAREICAILDCYRADTGEEPCFDHEAIGEEVARRHDSLTAAICKALGQ